MTKRKFFSGNSLRQALVSAASFFGISPSEVVYRQVEKRHGFIKTRRKVVIEVDAEDPRRPLAERSGGDTAGGEATAGEVRAGEIQPRSDARRAQAELQAEPGGQADYPEATHEERTAPEAGWTGPGDHLREAVDEDLEEEEDGFEDEEEEGEYGFGAAGDDDEDDDDDHDEDDDEESEEDEDLEEYEEDEDEVDGNRAPEAVRSSAPVAVREPRGENRAPRRRRGRGRGRRSEEGGGAAPDRGRSPEAVRPPGTAPASGDRAPRGATADREQRPPRFDDRPARVQAPARRDDRPVSRDARREPPAAPPPATAAGAGGRRRRRSRGGRGGGGLVELPERPRRPSERYREATGELADATRQVLDRLLDVTGIDVTYTVLQGDERLEVDLMGPDEALLTAEGGELLRAFEILVPRAVRGVTGEAADLRINSGDFHEIHEEQLRSLAQRTASEVRRSDRPRTLEPMTPADRRIIHITLADEPGVTSASEGHGYLKRIVVKPA